MSPLAERLRRLAEQGHTCKEAATLMGVARNTAQMTASRCGFAYIYEVDRRAWLASDAAHAGLRIAEAARRLGMDRKAFHRLVRGHGVRFLTNGERRAAADAEAAAIKAREDANRMARWREAWAEKRAARSVSDDAPSPASLRITDEASLGAAMLAAAHRDRMACRERGYALVDA